MSSGDPPISLHRGENSVDSRRSPTFRLGPTMRAYVTARLKGKELFGHPIGLYALFMT